MTENTEKAGPTIKVEYKDSGTYTEKNDTVEIASYKSPKVTINIERKNDGENKNILSYNYVIYSCITNASKKEVCNTELKNSGSVEAHQQAKVTEEISIKEYLSNKIKIVVSSVDEYGNVSTVNKYLKLSFKDGPKCELVSDSNVPWINDPSVEKFREVKVKCIDTNGSGCEKEIYSQIFRDEAYKGTITIKDKSGKQTLCEVDVKIDKTAPSTPKITNSNNNKWTNKDYNVTAESTDKTSGIEKFQYRYPNSKDPKEQKWTDFSEKNKDKVQIPQTKERSEILEIRACDAAGNCSAAAKTTVKLDKTAPTCKVTKSIATPNGKNGWYTSKIDVNLVTENSTTDKATAIASNVSYGFATTNKVTYNSKNKYTQGTTQGVTYYGFVKDEAENTNTCNSGNIKVDTSAPTLVFTVKELYTAVATCTDDDSGLVNTGTSWNLSSNITHSYTCENKAGLTTTKSGKYTYSTCVVGSPNECVGDWETYSYSYACNCKTTCDYLPESVECWTFCSTCYGTSNSWNNCAYTINTCQAGYVVS